MTTRNAIDELILAIYDCETQIANLKRSNKLEAKRDELKKLLMEQLSSDSHLIVVQVEEVQAKISFRNNAPKVDLAKMKELLHPNTYRAIVTDKEPSPVLEVKHVK